MGSDKLKIPPEFISASSEQRIEFVQELWDQIAQSPNSVQIPESHKRILQERQEALRTNPEAGRPWSEVREELLDKFCSEPGKDTSSRGGGR